MGILDKYVAKQVLFTIILVSFFLLILVALITFIDQMRYIGRGEIDFTFLIGYLGLQLPGIFVQFFPIAVLLGGVIGLGMMARSSELIIMQSVGISRAGIVLSALKLVFPVIILVAVMGEVLVPRIEQYAANQYNRYASNGNISITYDGLWIREGSSFIGVRYTMSDNSLLDIVRYDFNGDNLAAVSKAKTGSYENGSWVMHDVDKTLFEAGQVKPVHLERENWQLHLNPDRVQILGVKSANLTVEGLADYISYLEGNGQDSATFRLELYNKLAQPFTMVVMLLLAASTVFGPLRSMTMGARIVAGIALGFAFYVANQFGSPFALVYGLPPLLGAALPTLIFFCFALYLLRAKT